MRLFDMLLTRPACMRPAMEVAARAAFIGAVCCFTLTGCSTQPVKRPSTASSTGSSAIQELNLLSMPMALNLDADPGADGIAVKLFANDSISAKTVALSEGKIEILMYDGIVNAGTKDIPPALHIWTYTPLELKPLASSKSIGTSYELVLSWGTDSPKMKNITVIARHISNQGKTVYSGPVTITVSSF